MATERIDIPYRIEQDEDGIWCGEAMLFPDVWAFGDGSTPEAAMADLRESLLATVEEFGFPTTLPLEVVA